MLLFDRLSLAVCLLGVGLSYPLISTRAIAQTNLPTCPAPASQEYLLLVRGNTAADRERIASVLPADNTVLICDYLNEVLVRAGGFTSLETANAWAAYMTTVEGFESFVARPVAEASVTEQPVAAESVMEQPVTEQPITEQPVNPPVAEGTVASSGDGGYQPQRLATGYAVLVDFGDRPEIAATVGQIATPVGLAVYQQRAYLLAEYTRDAAVAEATLQRLSNAQLSAVVVDAQQVVQMTANVVR